MRQCTQFLRGSRAIVELRGFSGQLEQKMGFSCLELCFLGDVSRVAGLWCSNGVRGGGAWRLALDARRSDASLVHRCVEI